MYSIFRMLLPILFLVTTLTKGQSNFEFWKMANERDKVKDYDGVVQIMNRAIKLNPKYAPHYFVRAEGKHNLGDYKGAILDYTKTIQIDPKHYPAYEYRANSKYRLGRTFTFAVHKAHSERIQPGLDNPKFCEVVDLVDLVSKIHRWDGQC